MEGLRRNAVSGYQKVFSHIFSSVCNNLCMWVTYTPPPPPPPIGNTFRLPYDCPMSWMGSLYDSGKRRVFNRICNRRLSAPDVRGPTMSRFIPCFPCHVSIKYSFQRSLLVCGMSVEFISKDIHFRRLQVGDILVQACFIDH